MKTMLLRIWNWLDLDWRHALGWWLSVAFALYIDYKLCQWLSQWLPDWI